MRAPGAVERLLDQAVEVQRAGRLSDAEALYRHILAERPRHAIASHNLAVVIASQRGADQALEHFKAALEEDPAQSLYWLSYARALVHCGRPEPALQLLERGRRGGLSGPAFDSMVAEARLTLADALAAQGELARAIEVYRSALAAGPQLAAAHLHLGSLLSETGAIAEGFAHLIRGAELLHGSRRAPPPGAARHRLKHDREQRDHLAELGLGSGFHLADGERLAEPAVNPANATPEITAHWRSAEPQVVVIDDFLSPAALAKLRAYCAESTIWRRDYEAGYIGATPADGFACPLLAQIAEEIQATWPEIFGPHRFRYLGAFKYDSEYSTGTNTHADFAAVNVNFYIAPNEANLDPSCGGMEIWNLRAADEAEMRRLNGDEQAAREAIVRAKATSIIVPHRANRAVFFDSALLHRTDRCVFREGYLMKRINVSLLFGEFGSTRQA